MTRENLHLDRSVESPFGTPLVETMLEALRCSKTPTARTVPYCLSAGTDNKTFASLGMTGYGFVPLRLTPDLDFAAMFHGVDERVPVSALDFGARSAGPVPDGGLGGESFSGGSLAGRSAVGGRLSSVRHCAALRAGTRVASSAF